MKVLALGTLALLAVAKAVENEWYEPEQVEQLWAQKLSETGLDLASGYRNHPICQAIKGSDWWSARVARKDQSVQIKEMDLRCYKYNGKVRQCKSTTEIDGEPTRCEIVGAKSRVCRGNPCNFLNDGTCDLERTHGECAWFNNRNRKKFNNYWRKSKNPYKPGLLGGRGCFRNPCNMAGLGKPENAVEVCSSLSVPGLYTCTWCMIPGEGMGCQMTKINSWKPECTSNVKAIRKGLVSKSRVVMRGSFVSGKFKALRRGGCQCSLEYTKCAQNADFNDAVGIQSVTYAFRYPSPDQ